MFDFIIGNVVHIESDFVVVENNNIGYRIKTNGEKFSILETREDVKIYTELIVRQEDISLYGFLSKDERTIYNMLTLVTGVGPKAAMAILSTLSSSEIRQAILMENPKEFIRAPGIGKKSSERIILELKDRISKHDFEDIIDLKDVSRNISDNESVEEPAIEALISLGYNRYEVLNIMKKINSNLALEDTIKEALKLLAR